MQTPVELRGQRIVIGGGTGFIGSAVSHRLKESGADVTILSRDQTRSDVSTWDPEVGKLDESVLDGAAAVINLAGESLSDGRWSAARKQRILDSRVRSTALLVEGCRSVKDPPSVFISASAVGYYPLNSSKVFDEDGPCGESFLASVCLQWEQAAQIPELRSTRLCILRLGVVLGAGGGALAKLVPLFRSGVGGPVGNGEQRLSWISLEDVVAIIVASTTDRRYSGVINAVAPNPVSNRDFAKQLGAALGRPAVVVAPSFAVRFAYGQMAEETVLADNAVVSKRLPPLGFTYRHADLQSALHHNLGTG